MHIVIIGAGKVGKTLGGRWQDQGHQITYACRNPEDPKYQDFDGTLVTTDKVVAIADVIVLATNWGSTQEAVMALGDCQNKILIDATNPLTENKDALLHPDNLSGGEQVAQWVTNARVIKAFNNVGFPLMANPVVNGKKTLMYICGDDAEARSQVKSLSDALDFDTIEFGDLSRAKMVEYWALTWITLAYHHDMSFQFGFTLEKP